MAYMSATETTEVLSIDKLVFVVCNFETLSTETVNWLERPVSSELETYAANKVMFLIELQQVLIRDYLLKSFYRDSKRAMRELSKKQEYSFVAKPLHGNAVEDIYFEQLSFKIPKTSS